MSSEVFRTALSGNLLNVPVDVVTIEADQDPGDARDSVAEFEGSPEEVADLIDGHTIVLVHGAPVTRNVLKQNPSLRLLGVARGGPVNIDLAAAREHGVTVTTTPGKNAQGVADLTLGFLIQLWRNVTPSYRHVLDAALGDDTISDSAFQGARWFGAELQGRRLGLLGLGNVARRVAAHALSLGMEVMSYDPFISEEVPGVTMYGSLQEMLGLLDGLSLHARVTPENRHLVDREVLAGLPRGAILVNTARESLVEENHLLEALNTGHLSGAALDVFEPDGRWKDLVRHPRVLVTPHIAGATHETLARGAHMLVEEVARFLSGEELQWAVQ